MLNKYFDYSANERRAFYVLAGLCVLVFLLPATFPYWVKAPEVDMSGKKAEMEAWLAAVEAKKQSAKGKKSYERKEDEPNQGYKNYYKPAQQDKPAPSRPKKQFPFNPNTASEEDLLNLGLDPRTVQSVINYRSKGGKFRIKQDFSRIYTLSEEDFNRLYTFIELPDELTKPIYADDKKKFGNDQPNNGNLSPNPAEKPAYPSSQKKKDIVLDINSATAADFEQLYGIGAAFAGRIVKYRESLGGFISVAQVGEVYGLADSTFQKIKPNLSCPNPNPRKININSATVEQLKHPYMSFGQCKAIVRYRNEQGGKIKNLDYLQTLIEFNDEKKTAVRVKAYLSLD